MTLIRARAGVLLLRPHQWVKNTIVLLPGLLTDGFAALTSIPLLVATAGFCLLASAVYAINDVADADADRRHPVKRHRPVAAGAVPVRLAVVLAAVAAAGALLAGLWSGVTSWFALYAAVNIAYSFGAKRVPYLEILLVSSGFPLRALVGFSVVDNGALAMLPVALLAGATCLVAAKRLSEQAAGTFGTRAVLERYRPDVLRILIVAALVIAYAALLAWVLPSLASGSLWSLITLAAVAFGEIRIARLALTGRLEAPDRLVRDPHCVVAGLAALVSAMLSLVG